MKSKEIIGRVEKVWFPDLLPDDHDGVLAKIDTGADSGALHCTFVNYVTVDGGANYLEYQALDEQHKVVKTTKFTRVRTKSSNGQTQRRFRVQSQIVIRGVSYPIELSITDRTDMEYDVILGWRFLKDKFLVDVSETNEVEKSA